MAFCQSQQAPPGPKAICQICVDGGQGDRRLHFISSTFIELEGTSLKAALDIARKFGLVTEAVLPFGLPDSAGSKISEKLYRGGTSQTFFALAAQLKIASYFNLGANLDNWKMRLAPKGQY